MGMGFLAVSALGDGALTADQLAHALERLGAFMHQLE